MGVLKSKKGGNTMKSLGRAVRTFWVGLFVLAFFASTVHAFTTPTFKIAPKGNKKIRIGVMDPLASFELAALFNRLHMEAAKSRGWDLQYFDLKDNYPESVNYMENMISAGYDAIIIHFVGLKVCDKQIKKAFDMGIPVITVCAQGAKFPGVVAEIGPMDAALSATVAEYVASRIGPGEKLLTYHIPLLDIHALRFNVAKAVFQAYNRQIAHEFYYSLTGDNMQWGYDQAKNALLGDTKKEIKGVWSAWEGFGISAARAARDMGRDDIIVATMDDSPNTYTELARLPALQAISGFACMSKDMNNQIFSLLEKIFKGEPIPSQKAYPYPPRLVTKENMPPKGYFANPCGYNGPPDFVVK